MGTIEEKGNLKQQLYPHKRLQPNRSRRNQDIHILFNVQLSQISLYAYLIINGQCNSGIYEERNKEVQNTLVRNMCVLWVVKDGTFLAKLPARFEPTQFQFCSLKLE
jgi:hypothetical protein